MLEDSRSSDTNPAEMLQRAAGLMRERAKAAATSVPASSPEWHAVDPLMASGKTQGDAEHIASWHPRVALAVADLLNTHFCYIDPDEMTRYESEMHDAVNAVVAAYLRASA